MNPPDFLANSTTESILEALRLPDDFSPFGGGTKQPLKPTFGKLNRHRFSRVHPGSEYKYRAILVTDKENGGDNYLSVPFLTSHLGGMATPRILRLAVDNSGTPRLIAEPIADCNARPNLWNDSMVRAIRMAETSWVRIESNMSAGQYEITVAKGDLGQPSWPSLSMNELVMECFYD
jgi:hypothetical protein